MSGNAGGAAAKSRRHMHQRPGLPYAREARITRASIPCTSSPPTPGGSTLFRVAGYVARRVPILRHWWTNADGEQPQNVERDQLQNADGEQPQNSNEHSDEGVDHEHAEIEPVREEDHEAAEHMRRTLAALSKKLSPSQFRACLREVGADVAQSPSNAEPAVGMGADAHARIMAQAPRSPAIEAMARPPAPKQEATIAPSLVDTPYAHVRSLMHEGMQRRRRAMAACRAPPSTGAPMHGGLPVLHATRLRQNAEHAFATPYVRTGMAAPSTSGTEGVYAAETPRDARVAGFSSYGPLLTRTQPRSTYFASAESPAPVASNSMGGWGTPVLPRTAGGLTMLKRRRGAMDDGADQPDFVPPPTTLRRLNLAMDASPAINQATPGYRETAAPASNVVTTDTARRILQTLDQITAPMDSSPSKTAADSRTPGHVATNTSSDAFPPPPTAALPQFVLEKEGTQAGPSIRVNPVPVHDGPSTSDPSSSVYGVTVGDTTVEKRNSTETPTAPSTSPPPPAQSPPSFGFHIASTLNHIVAAQPRNGPKNAPTSFPAPVAGIDTKVSNKIGDDSGSLTACPSNSSRPTLDPPGRCTLPQVDASVFVTLNGANDTSVEDEQPVSFSFADEPADGNFNALVTQLANEVGSQPVLDPMPHFTFGGRKHVDKEASTVPGPVLSNSPPASNPQLGSFMVGHASKSSLNTANSTPSSLKPVHPSDAPPTEDQEQQGAVQRVPPSTAAVPAPGSPIFSVSESAPPKSAPLPAGGGWGADFMQRNQAQQKKAADDIAKEIEESKSGGGSSGSGGNVTSFAMPAGGSSLFGTTAAPAFGVSAASTPTFTFGASTSTAPDFGAGSAVPAAPTPAFSFGAPTATFGAFGAAPSSGASFSKPAATPPVEAGGTAPVQPNALSGSAPATAASATVGLGDGTLNHNQAQQEKAVAGFVKDLDAAKNVNGAGASASPKPAFTFGGTSGAATPVFGTPPSSAAAPAVPILFGNQSASASAPPLTLPAAFSFGGGPPTSTALTAAEPKPAAAFVFGGNSSAPAFTAPASTSSFVPLFGGSAGTSSGTTAPSFLGSTASAPTSPPAVFGSGATATASEFGSAFGVAGTSASAAPANPFCSAAVFATPASTAPGVFSFGGASTPASSSGSAPAFGVFGASSPAPAFGASSSAVFGQPTTTGSLFGAVTPAAPNALFGGSPGIKMNSSPGFGATNAQSTASLFGSATPLSNTSPAGFVFGGGANLADVPTSTPNNPFGASLARSTSGNGVFGAPMATPPAGSLFGAGSQNMSSTPAVAFAFNAAAASPAPVFGGAAAAPAFEAPGSSPAPFPFGSHQGVSHGVPGSDLATPTFGFSMGGAGDAGGGKRRVLRKAKRPGK